MPKIQKGEERELINKDGLFNLAFKYSDIINSKEFQDRSEKDNRMTLGLKALNGIATAKAELDVICEYINATEEEKKKWFEAALNHTTKELQSKYINKATEIKTQLGLRQKNDRSAKPTVEDLF